MSYAACVASVWGEKPCMEMSMSFPDTYVQLNDSIRVF